MPNMLDLKWAVFIGAVIVDERVWSRIRPEHQKVMMEIAYEIGGKYQESGRNTEAQAIETMKEYGMKVKTPTTEELKVWEEFKEEIMPDVIETYVPEEIYEKVTSALNE